MPEDNPLGDRGRAFEEDYFRKRDRELIEKMRKASVAEDARREMSSRTGLQDPAMLQELEALGFTPDTVALLPLVPLVQMAWAEGGVSDAERKLIVKLARVRRIEEGSAADRQLAGWLSARPDPQVFARASRLDPRDARCARRRPQPLRRRSREVLREHRGGLGRDPRHQSHFARGARAAEHDRQRPQVAAIVIDNEPQRHRGPTEVHAQAIRAG